MAFYAQTDQPTSQSRNSGASDSEIETMEIIGSDITVSPNLKRETSECEFLPPVRFMPRCPSSATVTEKDQLLAGALYPGCFLSIPFFISQTISMSKDSNVLLLLNAEQ